MAGARYKTSITENDPKYRLVRPKLTIPRLFKAHSSVSEQVIPNDLYWASEIGNINLLADILIHTYDVNITDVSGRTPLHAASENNQLQAADWLMFKGADPHKKDYESRSPMSLSHSNEMTQILSQSSTGRRPDIVILMDDFTCDLDSLDIWIETDSTFGPNPSYMACRRQTPSRSTLRYRLKKDEHFWRDVIEYKVSLVNTWSNVTLKILVVDLPPSSSELILKLEDADGHVKDLKPDLKKFEVNNTDCWMAKVQCQLDNYGCFALCSRSKSEILEIPRYGGSVVSSSNASVKLAVPPHAFKKPGNVLFTIEEAPELEKEDTILSMSSFFSMEHTSGSDAAEDLEVTLPVPEGYTGEGEVVVLSRPTTSTSTGLEDDEEEQWEVRDGSVDVQEGRVSFWTNKMGINASVEIERGTSRVDVRNKTAKLFSKRKECHVKFLVLGKVLSFNQFDIIVECVKSDQIYLRLHEWKTESYTKLRLSGDFPAQHNQKYRLELTGNLECLYGLSDLHLEFLPGQTSHQSLLVNVPNTNTAPNGTIAVHKVGDEGLSLVTHLPLLLEEQLHISQTSNEDKTDKGASQISERPKSRAMRRTNSFPVSSNSNPTSDKMSRSQPISFRNDYDDVDAVPVNNESHAVGRWVEVDEETETLDTKYNDVFKDPEHIGIPKAFHHQSKDLPFVHGYIQGERGVPQNSRSTDRNSSGRVQQNDNAKISSQDSHTAENRKQSDSFIVDGSHRRVGRYRRTSQSTTRTSDCLPAGVGESVRFEGAAGVVDVATAGRGDPGADVEAATVSADRCGTQFSEPAAASSNKVPLTRRVITPPVSDNFFVQLVKVMDPNFLMFISLGLTHAEITRLQRDMASMSTEYTMFVMLVQCRKKRGDRAAFLHSLLSTLEEFDQNDTLHSVVDWTKQWLQNESEGNPEFAEKIRPVIKRFDNY